MKNDIVVGLDIGSSNIKLVIGQNKGEYGDGRLSVIGAVSHPSAGVGKGGMINSIEDVVSSLSACLEKAERLVGLPISSVWLSFNNSKIRYEKTKGVAIISKNDGEIDYSDIERAIDSAKSFPVPNNYEIVDTIPVRYNIDSNEDVKSPIGMNGVRLEVEVLVVLALSGQINNLIKIVHRANLDIDGLFLPSLSLSSAFLSNKEKELGSAVVDIGSTTTSLAVYEDGNLLHLAVLPIGSEHITSDIALGLKCPISLAEKIKTHFGNADSEGYTDEDEIDISSILKDENVDDLDIISSKYLSQIIEARVEEIFSMVDDELKKINRSRILPVGVFLSGGGILLKNIQKIAKKVLALPVANINTSCLKIEVDRAQSPEFFTALSLLVSSRQEGNKEKRSNFLKNNLGGIADSLGNFFKKIIPR
ncbi:cell division protein FtsA [Candidatus Falkowbacteria bacterium HGW-Falkowbacteria-1]|uniref:Cell division protein FtsA n=1 Tax=Candidatus Falkowbacteria bacterium HGW-Falkowbacteria-1 TaxID=2013768 RepID=A0A2N2E8P7_9BACT|nr:MAG: cell division protein FtsA [Candidatus Falkowbacteria bacterium HGW-Falkowbacteria-1]